jgi:hypothetical protein
MSVQRKNDVDLEQFDRDFDVEKLAQEAGMTKNRKESSAKWPKYDAPNGDVVLICSAGNVWRVVSSSGNSNNNQEKGGAAAFVCKYLSDGQWGKATFDKLREYQGVTLEYKPQYSPEEIKSIQFNDEKRSKHTYYIEKYTDPVKSHPYLVDDRLISPSLLKQGRFINCIRQSRKSDKSPFINALMVHRDYKGVCAYEKHNSTKSGNLNLISKDSRKCLWYSDDILRENVKRIFIGEAAIDALSFASLVEHSSGGDEIALMTFGGQFDRGCRNMDDGSFVEDHFFIKSLKRIFDKTHASEILLGHDNDDAGRDYDQFFCDFFDRFYPDKFKVLQNKAPLHLDDWNDYLVVHRFNEKAKHLDLAKKTKQAFIAEAGAGCFRIIPSETKPGNVVIAVPPAGFMTSKMKSVANSFIAKMYESDNESMLIYTASSINKSCSHAKKIEKFRRENLPNMVYRKTAKIDPLSLLNKKQLLNDASILTSWKGYRQVINRPHNFAEKTGTIILTESDNNEIQYFHNNQSPIKMIVAVPPKDKLTKNHKIEVKLFVRDTFRFGDQETIDIHYSPCQSDSNGHSNTHCEFFNNIIQELSKPDKYGNTFESELDKMIIHQDKPLKSASNILEHLDNQGLLKRSKSIVSEHPPIQKKNIETEKQNNSPAMKASL